MNGGSIAQKSVEALESKRSERGKIGTQQASLEDRGTLFLVPKRDAEELSPWSQSTAKRCFDCICVLFALPLFLPLLLLIAVAVRLTSSGPIFFLQKRVGAHGRTFTIFKFRTMLHNPQSRRHAVTTAENQPFTCIGPFLRRWKLDELPQVLNVLFGHMSLVGPRPKMPEHVKVDLLCRPGITGAATIAFAREELLLDRIPKHSLDAYYHNVVLPTKRQLDADYMAEATFWSDLKLILNSLLRRWDASVSDVLLEAEHFQAETRVREPRLEPVPLCTVVGEPVELRTGTR